MALLADLSVNVHQGEEPEEGAGIEVFRYRSPEGLDSTYIIHIAISFCLRGFVGPPGFTGLWFYFEMASLEELNSPDIHQGEPLFVQKVEFNKAFMKKRKKGMISNRDFLEVNDGSGSGL